MSESGNFAMMLLLSCAMGTTSGACVAEISRTAPLAANEPLELYSKSPIGRTNKFVHFPIRWTFACDFPDQHKPPARFGFKYWDDLTPLELFEEVDECATLRHVEGIVVEYKDQVYVDTGTMLFRELVLGVTSRYGSQIGVLTGARVVYYQPWKGRNVTVKENVAIHEVGHAIGFMHVRRRDCVMYPVLFSRDRYQFERKHACDEEIEEMLEEYGGAD